MCKIMNNLELFILHIKTSNPHIFGHVCVIGGGGRGCMAGCYDGAEASY